MKDKKEKQTGSNDEEGKAVSEIEELKKRLEEQAAQIEELKNQAARATADYYNFRKRVERDREQNMKFAAEKAVNILLPVFENLERVIASIKDSEDSVAKGISMVAGQFVEAMKQLGLEEIPTDGRFDPALHEALMLEPTDEKEKDGEILSTLRKGYKLAGKVLQAAQVRVAKFEETHTKTEE